MILLELAKHYPEKAEPILEGLVAVNPNNLLTIRLLGLAKFNLGKLEEAIDLFKQAMELDPDDAETNNQLALAHRESGNIHMALLYMTNAVDLSPTPQNWTNLGKLFIERKKLDSAKFALKEAVKLNPNFASAQYELSLVYGLQGRWSEFFPQYEWRLRYFDDLDAVIWDGSDIQNKKLLVHGEQGYGDWIHFARFLSLARERGAYVILHCPTTLIRLLLPLVDEVVDGQEQPPQTDFRCSIVSLPWLLMQPAGVSTAPTS